MQGRSWESLLAAVVLAAGVALPCTLGSLSVSPVEVLGVVIGTLSGIACAWGSARTGSRPRRPEGRLAVATRLIGP